MDNTILATSATVTDLLTATEVVSYDIDSWCVKEARKASRFATVEETHPTLEPQPVTNPAELAKQATDALAPVVRYNHHQKIEAMTAQLNADVEAFCNSPEFDQVTEADKELLAQLFEDATPEEHAMFDYPLPHQVVKAPIHLRLAQAAGSAAGYVYRHRRQIIDTTLEAAAIAAILAFACVAGVVLGVAWCIEHLPKKAGTAVEVASVAMAELKESAVALTTRTLIKASRWGYQALFSLLVAIGVTVAVFFTLREVAKSTIDGVNHFFDSYIAGI